MGLVVLGARVHLLLGGSLGRVCMVGPAKHAAGTSNQSSASPGRVQGEGTTWFMKHFRTWEVNDLLTLWIIMIELDGPMFRNCT